MSKLTALKKQIAALEAQAERIAKTEMSSAIAKVKGIMAEFNLTIEHLAQSVTGKRAAKKMKTKAKAKTASVAKYIDPKSGKTWSGFGRAPGWIAGAKNRDAFLVGKTAVADSAAVAPVAAKKASAKSAKAVKVARKAAKPVAKKAVAAVKQAAPVAAKKKPVAKKAAAKKSAPKTAASKRAAAAPVAPAATPAA